VIASGEQLKEHKIAGVAVTLVKISDAPLSQAPAGMPFQPAHF
jgi:hypothetical protein